MSDDWSDNPPTGGRMADELKTSPGTGQPMTGVEHPADGTMSPPVSNPAVSEEKNYVESTVPLVRLAPAELSSTFVIPQLGGLAIGKQWQRVTADQLTAIVDAARRSRVNLETEEG